MGNMGAPDTVKAGSVHPQRVILYDASGNVLLSSAAPGYVKVLADDGTALFAVPPQLDDTDKLAVSLYGKGTAAGDTAVKVGEIANGQAVTGVTNVTVGLGRGGGGTLDPLVSMFGAGSGASAQTVIPAALALLESTNQYRVASQVNSTNGAGVLQVGTLGEVITLFASAARTASANGTAVTGLGWRNRYIILFDLTNADTDAGDTLDVYVDVSPDNGTTWLNAVHFTQIVGTDAASKRFAVLDPSNPGTSEILVTADAAAGAVRPSLFGTQMRGRCAVVDAGTDDATFTFSLTALAI